MATHVSSGDQLDDLTLKSRGWLDAIFMSPVLWGAALTAGFYAALPHLPVQRALVERYCAGHVLEYVEVTLFFLGIAILGMKVLSLGTQKSALKLRQLYELPGQTDDAVQNATRMMMVICELPRRFHQTFLVRRIAEVCQNVRGLGSTKNLYEHQQYLSDIGAERLHESFGLIRTITWAIPILGFLGTVMGITIAIANVQPEQLTESMDKVTGGLGVAFDTTTLGLALTLGIVFLTHWVEKSEQSILHEVDEIAFNHISSWFPAANDASPLLQAEQQAAEQLLKQTEAVVAHHTQTWQANIDRLREQWSATLEKQQSSLAASLHAGTESTLADHARQLAAGREELLKGYQRVSQEIAGMMSAHRETLTEQQLAAQQLLDQQRQLMFDEIATIRDDLKLQTEQITAGISATAAQWNTELSAASQALTGQMGQMQAQGDLLSRIIEQEENLTRLQGTLAENLNAIRSVEAFDETLHNLSAAVHLLTVRSKAA